MESEEEEEACVICLEPLNVIVNICQAPGCGHRFHTACMMMHVHSRAKISPAGPVACPLCRAVVIDVMPPPPTTSDPPIDQQPVLAVHAVHAVPPIIHHPPGSAHRRSELYTLALLLWLGAIFMFNTSGQNT